MRRILAGTLALLLLAPLSARDDKDKDKPKDQPATPAEQVKSLEDEYDKAYQEFLKAYQAAKTPEDKQKLISDKMPKAQDYAGRFLELARKNPKDPAAVKALVWVMTRSRGGKEYDTALDILARDHLDDPSMLQVAQNLANGTSPAAEKLLRGLLEKNKSKEVQGWAAYSLASQLKNQAEARGADKAAAEKALKEAEQLFERVEKEYAEIPYFRDSTLGKQANGSLFELRHLAIGKPVPEIEGEDLDGKKFKLSDYRGKVVLIDFWGNW
jgi:hypothetical protein